MQPQSDPRHNSRIIALQTVFQQEFQKRGISNNHINDFNNQALLEIDEIKNYDKELALKLIKNLPKHQEALDKLIAVLAPEWPVEKIALVDLLILRLALLEGFTLKITPQKVVMNEAIELSKEFSTEQTRKFISGVLGNLYINQENLLNDDNRIR